MAEYIDREQVLNLLKSYGIKRGNKVFGIADIGDAIMSVEDLPTADVAPVKHGKWIHNDEWWEFICTSCHRGIGNIKEYKYCPNCGAKMDLE